MDGLTHHDQTGGLETDFYAWATEQARLLRAGNLSDADIGNIAEELDSMGRAEKRELVSRPAVLLAHLLKWRFQPSFRGNSWRLTIAEQRGQLEEHLKDNPSLKSTLPDSFATAYRFALFAAQRETGLPEDVFPPNCPWTKTKSPQTNGIVERFHKILLDEFYRVAFRKNSAAPSTSAVRS